MVYKWLLPARYSPLSLSFQKTPLLMYRQWESVSSWTTSVLSWWNHVVNRNTHISHTHTHTHTIAVGVLLIWRLLVARRRRQITLTHPSSFQCSCHSNNHSRHKPLIALRPISELLSNYNITLVDSEHDCELFLSERIPPDPGLVGLDCEWVNRDGLDSAPVALLQLAFFNGQCLLVRVFRMATLGPRLTDLLTNRG